MKLINGNII